MQVFKHQSNLAAVVLRLITLQFALVTQVSKQLTPLNVFEYEVEVTLILGETKHFDLKTMNDFEYQKGMVDVGEDGVLADDMIDLFQAKNFRLL